MVTEQQVRQVPFQVTRMVNEECVRKVPVQTCRQVTERVPRQVAVQAEIAHAFRIAFLTIAGFAVTGLFLALSIPLRRI